MPHGVSLEPSLLLTVALCLVVFLAGLVDAIAGGGGLLSLPAYLAVGLPPHMALATNKFSSVLGTLTAALRYLRAGKLQLATGLLAAGGALAGSAAGARLVLLIPPATVQTIVLVLVPTALVVLLLLDRFRRRAGDERAGRAGGGADHGADHGAGGAAPGRGVDGDAAGEPGAAAGRAEPLPRRDGLWALAIGAGVGTYDGFFGPGTGTFMTIAFHAGLGLSLLVSAGNARLANLASNVGAVVVFLYSGRVLFPLGLYTAAAGVLGNQVGAALALRKGDRVVKPLLVLVLIVLLVQVARERFAG